MAVAAPAVVTLLQSLPVLSSLPADRVAQLGERCEYLQVRTGDVVAAGESHDSLFLVVDGRLRVVSATSRDTIVATLMAGASFNEGPLLEASPSTLILLAEIPAQLLRLRHADLRRFLDADPERVRAVQAAALDRDCRGFLENCTALAAAPPESLQRLLQSLSRRRLEIGDLLIREGDRATEVYFVSRGQLRVFRHDHPALTLAMLSPGSVVGETAVLQNQPRNADVVAITSAAVLVVPASAFLDLVSEQQPIATYFDALIGERTAAAVPPPAPLAAPAVPAAPSVEPAPEIIEWSDRVIPPQRGMWARLFGPGITLQQSEMDCGAACLSTICRFYGRAPDINWLRTLANVSLAGASMLDVKTAAESLGFETHAFRQPLRDLQANHLPAIVNWRGYHWLVVERAGDKTVTLADPGQGRVRLTTEEFAKDWTGYVLYLRPTAAFLDVKSSSLSLKRFLPLLRPHVATVWRIGIAAFCVQLLQLLLPLLSKFIMDDVVVQKDSRWLVPAIAAVAVGTLARIVVGFSRQQLLLYLSSTISFDKAQEFWRQLLKLPLRHFETRRTGDITSRLGETSNIAHFLAGQGIQVFIDAAGVFGYLGLMLYLNWKLTLIAIAALIAHYVNLSVTRAKLRHASQAMAQRGAETSNHLVESLAGLRTIKLLGVERYAAWTYDNLLARQANASFSMMRTSVALSVAGEVISRMGSLAVLFAGASLALSGSLSIGSLLAFLVVSESISGPVASLAGFWDDVQRFLVSAERMGDVSDAEAEPGAVRADGLVELPRLQGRLRLSGVSFRYAPGSRDVLQRVSLEIQPGQTVAFVGRSGSGKSTLIRVLLGFNQPTAGSLVVDGFDLATVWLPSLRRQVAMVPQDAHLFRDSVRANISLGRPDASLAEVMDAAKLAGAHDFITALPQGYDTVLAERGANLSGGQRQRVAIARALAQNAPLLILDEATSALDNESERFVLQNLRQQFEHRTVIIIAHRLSTVRRADLIVVLDRGLILEQGSHDALMARRGLYFTLCTQQLQV